MNYYSSFINFHQWPTTPCGVEDRQQYYYKIFIIVFFLECDHNPCDKVHCPHGRVCVADLYKCTAKCECPKPKCDHDCGEHGVCIQDPHTCKSQCSK